MTESIDRKEATNKELSKGEKDAIDCIKKEKDKTKVEGLIKDRFSVPEGEKNIEIKDALKFFYESMIDQIYALYKTDKNESMGRDDKATLESAFFFMKLYNPDAYANETGAFQRTYVTGAKKDLFYAAVEKEIGEIFNHPSVLYEKNNIEKTTLDKDEYEKNKDQFAKEGWKMKNEKTVEGTPEKILVPGKSITDFPKQYFYKGMADIDITKGIKDMVPGITTKIEELKKDKDIDPTSIQLEVSGSVSNIRYNDNEALLGNRSRYIQSQLEGTFADMPVNINNPKYTGYGAEWGPSYPPTAEDMTTVFTKGSEGRTALNAVGFTTLEEVTKSIHDEGDKSKYFDVVEQYMYREYQYAEVKVTYKERKEIPTDKKIVELEKENGTPNLNDGMIKRKSGQIIAENPYWNGKPGKGVYQKINGITFPLHAQYIALQISDNKLLDPTQRYALTSNEYSDKMKHTITNTQLKERKNGKGSTVSEELCLHLDRHGVDSFSANLIKSDEDAGKSVTNKETSKFIEQYIMNPELASANQKEI